MTTSTSQITEVTYNLIEIIFCTEAQNAANPEDYQNLWIQIRPQF